MKFCLYVRNSQTEKDYSSDIFCIVLAKKGDL